MVKHLILLISFWFVFGSAVEVSVDALSLFIYCICYIF
jgi:hypothetical protein